jgi:transcriptional regulator with GAF, ATPase, and Fis domain
MEKTAFKRSTMFRITPEDKEVLRQAADRLGLNESEVARRSMRLGLKVLSKSKLPGSKIEVEVQ